MFTLSQNKDIGSQIEIKFFSPIKYFYYIIVIKDVYEHNFVKRLYFYIR